MSQRQPAEWAKHQAVWTAYPYDPEAWFEHLDGAKREFIELCRTIALKGGERLEILIPNEAFRAEAEQRLAGVPCNLHVMRFGDSWLRDTAPVWCKDDAGRPVSVCFKFNGWGGKYVMDGDDELSSKIAEIVGYKTVAVPLVLEGGSIDADGEGTALTTRQCLLNTNRNPGMSQAAIEKIVSDAYGLKKLIWLDDGLLNDHTDGHIDNIARFVAPGKVVAMEPKGKQDPNCDTLNRIIATLEAATDAQGRRLQVIRIPSVGRILGDDGAVMPASYMNFYIANDAVIVPIYGSPQDAEAVEKIGACFPGRKAVGLPANSILTGGGSFHCITQQQPKV